MSIFTGGDIEDDQDDLPKDECLANYSDSSKAMLISVRNESWKDTCICTF